MLWEFISIRSEVKRGMVMKHILIVDDNKMNLVMAKQELSGEYRVTPVTSGAQALLFLSKMQTDLILLDINMPDMDGRETMRKIRENEAWKQIPIIFLTADSSPETEAQCLSDGADDFIAKPFVPQVMRSRIERILELHDLRHDLEARLDEKTKQLELVTLNAIMAIAKAIEAKDRYTSGHSDRVASCSVMLAERMGWDEEQVRNLQYAALLHDIGKIGVPDHVLNKPVCLNEEEVEIIRQHVLSGGEILKEIHTIPNLKNGAMFHHERYDGTGYPMGLKGGEIPIEARIIAVADTYDAMTSNRAYRDKLSTDVVVSELEKGRGTQFDPEIVDLFMAMLKEGFTL